MGWRPTRHQWWGIWPIFGGFWVLWLIDPTPRCRGCMGAIEDFVFWQRLLLVGGILVALAVAQRLIGNDD
jgi:hypothetical protein